ncbi:MAG TPA: hypothetical protein VK983_04905 [Candidatus Limnocylindrales bacterium]|nr:hypothetical protein [Candidatus Limnocylindrales bacterium]
MRESFPSPPNPNQRLSPMSLIREQYQQHPRLGKLAVAAGIYAIAHSGGGIDRAIDPFQDTTAVVEEAWGTGDTPLEERTFDNIPFSEYSPEAQDNFRAEDEAVQDVANRLSRTINDLDAHRTEAIQERAEAFRKAQGSNIMSDAAKEVHETAVREAENTDGVVNALDEFMSFFGKDAGLLQEDRGHMKAFDRSVDVDATKETAREIMGAISYLPKQMVQEAPFESIKLAGSSGMAMGQSHEGLTQELAIPVPSKTIRLTKPVLNALPDALQDPLKTKGHVLHEIGHSQNTSEVHDEVVMDLDEVIKGAAKDVIGRPEYVSQYATANMDEEAAENFSVAHDIEQGIEHPDEVRRFGSEANKKVLTELAASEEQYPGITDHLVSLNKKLMDK